ncbi:hypothetical protein D929_02199 [Enterococcus faecalis 02-MB-P-10]|uniref:hypothetical protein n=1 Tax=Enterococcus faecalis TaxID=1351 RepID=UPI00035399BC|nr:hypothetical protein [Enterococcus faecalis]EPH71485.1 hypothetical protein D929_02199 [Enterococcus faecalis 02-MB-P-10]
MNFYEIKDPYYALIAAKDKEECFKVYREVVSDIEGKETFYADLKNIDTLEALKILADAYQEDGTLIGLSEAFEQIENVNEQGELLVIDGRFIVIPDKEDVK